MVSNPLTDRLLGLPGSPATPDSPMLIVCPSCATSYDVELASLEPSGRRVRCVRCRAIWHAEPSRAEKLLAAAEAIAPSIQASEDAEPAFAHAGGTAADADGLDGPMGLAADADGSNAAEAPADNDIAGAEPVPGLEVEAPPIAPLDLDAERPPLEIDAAQSDEPASEPAEDIETYAARQQRLKGKRRPWRWPLSSLQNGILALLIIDGILIGWRDTVVRVMPQTASFYSSLGLPVNLRGVAFDGIVTTTEQHEGVPILVVEGNIVNESGKIVEVPSLKFAVRNNANDEIYSWTAVPPRTTLPPGEAVAFHSRLASPPPDGHDVLVRFVTRRDIVGGTH
jgi:predicted Zn finger-like uncharacterized protein